MGYRFTTGKLVQAQPVKTFSNTRLQTTFNADGDVVVVERSAATTQQREARRRSARATSGARSNREIAQRDYLLVPSSLRDLYLTGSHGITSLYPEILLTTPRTAKVIDVTSGLTTTPFLIDLNNQVKISVESFVKDALSRYEIILSLSTAQYDQSAAAGRQYAELCLQAAIAKDRLVQLFNIINVDLGQNVNQVSGIRIGNLDYTYMNAVSNLGDYLRNLDENYNIEVFTNGTNTQAITQILKTIHNYFVIGNIAFQDAGLLKRTRVATDGTIGGYLDGFYNSSINNLKLIVPGTEDNQTIVLLVAASNDTQRTRFSFQDFSNDTQRTKFSFQDFQDPNKITSLTRLIQRDIIVHGLRDSILQNNNNANTAQDLIKSYTGPYSSINYSAGETTPDYILPDIFRGGYTNIDEVLNSTVDPDLIRLRIPLITAQNGTNFGKLDTDLGIDYSLYQDLVTTSTPTFTNLADTVNLYYTYSQNIYNIITRSITSNPSAPQREIALNIKDYFLSFIQGSGIDTDTISSKGSAFRIGCFILAADDDIIAAKLFRLICTIDKKLHGSTNDPEIEFAKEKLYESITTTTGDRTVEASLNSNNNITTSGGTSDGSFGEFRISPSVSFDYMDGDDTSFQTFHNIVRRTEQAYIDDFNFQSNLNATTTFGLSLSRDARAFVIFNLFLAVLREMKMEVVTNTTAIDEMKIKYRPQQFAILKFALENTESTPDQLDATLNQYIADTAEFFSSFAFGQTGVDADAAINFKNDVRYFHSQYFNSIVQKIDQQNQTCFDLSNLLINHASQIKNQLTVMKSTISSVSSAIASNGFQQTESLLNATQLEQAFLKINLTDRYANLLRGAAYLPSAIDHNTGQATNTKTVVSTYPVLTDPTSDAVTRKFLVAVGIPTGLLETLRYKNAVTTTEHLYSIDLVFKNLQVSEEQEAIGSYVTKSYTFSSRIFVNEGAQLIGGADTKTAELSNYEQVYAATKFKVIDDTGVYRDITIADLERIMGSDTIVKNHFTSHYAKLFLKTVTGITLDEECFDLIPQARTYPDASQLANYTTIADGINSNFPASQEGQLNRERVLLDLSRAIQLAPQQHKTSMMISKTFERVHVIPIDINDLLNPIGSFLGTEAENISENDIAFIDVVASIRLEDAQPPVSFEDAPASRSYSNSLGERGDRSVTAPNVLSQVDAASQSAASVGINAMIETSNRFGGRLGGYRR